MNDVIEWREVRRKGTIEEWYAHYRQIIRVGVGRGFFMRVVRTARSGGYIATGEIQERDAPPRWYSAPKKTADEAKQAAETWLRERAG